MIAHAIRSRRRRSVGGVARAHGSEMAPNLAPMVDVVMVILIFFMLGTSFAASEGVMPLQLPADVGPGGGATVAITPLVRVTLEETESGRGVKISVAGMTLTSGSTDELFALLRDKRHAGADPRGRIVIAPQPGVRYRHVVSAFNACVRAGFQNVQFALHAPVDSPP